MNTPPAWQGELLNRATRILFVGGKLSCSLVFGDQSSSVICSHPLSVLHSQQTPLSLVLRKEKPQSFNGILSFFSSCIDSAVEKHSFHKVSLLRAFCKAAGVQLYLREYSLDNKSKQTFHEDDIIDMFPVAKNIHPKVRRDTSCCIV